MQLPEIKVVKDVYEEISNKISNYIENKKGQKVLEIGCYTRIFIRGKIFGKVIVLEKLSKKFRNVSFVGVDPDIPNNYAKKYRNLELYSNYIENLYDYLKEKYRFFDLIYSINVLHLVDDLGLHLWCIHDLLKPNGIFITGWNLIGVPKAENIPARKSQEIITILNSYFKILNSYVYVYPERDHYHIFLLLILKK